MKQSVKYESTDKMIVSFKGIYISLSSFVWILKVQKFFLSREPITNIWIYWVSMKGSLSSSLFNFFIFIFVAEGKS